MKLNRTGHYAVAPTEDPYDVGYLTACGIRISTYSTERSAMDPTFEFACKICENSQMVKDERLVYEIGCEGDWHAWVIYWDKKEPL